MIRTILARLLHLANSSPPWMLKREFYAIKYRLLMRYGTPDGCDVQHIPGKQCWTCNGTGIYDTWTRDDGTECEEYCWKCDGTGHYKSPKWICLDRWRFGEYTFHVPGAVSYTKPDPDITRITGYVEHRNYGRRSEEAFAWLCLLCGEWRLLWRWMTSSAYCRIPWWPMLTLQWSFGKYREFRNYVRSLFRLCDHCSRRFRRRHDIYCATCRDEYNSELSAAMDEVPF